MAIAGDQGTKVHKKYLWLLVLVICLAVVLLAVNHSNHSAQVQKTNEAIAKAKHLKIPASSEKSSNNTSTVEVSKVVGGYLTDLHGMTLYTYDSDPASVSKCNGDCAQKHPPYKPEGVVSLPVEWSVINRSDGSQQYAYKLKPLYYYMYDTSPGDITGALFGFQVAKP